MRTFAAIVFVVATMSLSVDPARAWSVRDEVTVSDPGLTATLVWEVINSASFCQSSPANLDRLSCTVIPDPAEFWFGLDAAGNAYGTVNVTDATGEHFDIFRRPVGTKQSQAIARVTKRKEPVFGQVTKMQLTLGSAIDTTGGVLLIALTGSCSTSACVAQGDTSDHLGVVKISGLPTLFDLALTYQPPSTLALKMPVHPDALPTTDRVDVFYGASGSMADLALAQPLACNVAPGARPGDVVQVGDPLPNPAVGQGRYYLAAVTSGIERRAGRRLVNGVLQGRVASRLPSCP